MRISYNNNQVTKAIAFLIANNPTAANMGADAVKRLILEYMVEIANMNKYSTISTLGFMVAGGGNLTLVEQAAHPYHFHVFVDPCVASNEYDFITVTV